MRGNFWARMAIDQLKEIELKRQSADNLRVRIAWLQADADGQKGTAMSLAPASGGELNREENRRVNNLTLQEGLRINLAQLEGEIAWFTRHSPGRVRRTRQGL